MLVQLIWYGFHLLMFQLNCLLVWLASAIYVCNMRAEKEALLRPNCIHDDVATFSFYVIPVGVVSIPIIYAIDIGFSKQIKSCLMHLHVASFRIGLQVSVSFTEMKLSLNRKTAKNIRLAFQFVRLPYTAIQLVFVCTAFTKVSCDNYMNYIWMCHCSFSLFALNRKGAIKMGWFQMLLHTSRFEHSFTPLWMDVINDKNGYHLFYRAQSLIQQRWFLAVPKLLLKHWKF